MNFFSYIRTFKNECNSRLTDINIKDFELQRDIERVKKELRTVNGTLGTILPDWIFMGLSGGSMIGLLFAGIFAVPFWYLYLIGAVLFGLLGILNEEFAKNKEDERFFLNQELNELYRQESVNNRNKKHIISLLGNVYQCLNYYQYMLDDSQKNIGITIRPQTVIDSGCMLSTFLDQFYKGTINEFLSLTKTEKQKVETTSRLSNQIYIARNESIKDYIPEQPKRRRRMERIHGITPQNVLVRR